MNDNIKQLDRFAVLDGAAKAVSDRENRYGGPSANFGRAAALANVILKDKLKSDAEISAADWVLLMIALKTARLMNEPDHTDSQVDLAGYASLLSEVA